MENQEILIPVDGLIGQPDGKRQSYNLEESVTFDLNGSHTVPPVKFELTLMKLTEGIHALVENLETSAKTSCNRCLKEMELDISVPETERVFFFEHIEQEDDDPFDIYLVDKKHRCINIYEMLRQEILLHFPDNPVCSTHCLGLCAYCGKQLKTNKCSCNKYEEAKRAANPFSQLKDLLK